MIQYNFESRLEESKSAFLSKSKLDSRDLRAENWKLRVELKSEVMIGEKSCPKNPWSRSRRETLVEKHFHARFAQDPVKRRTERWERYGEGEGEVGGEE